MSPTHASGLEAAGYAVIKNLSFRDVRTLVGLGLWLVECVVEGGSSWCVFSSC